MRTWTGVIALGMLCAPLTAHADGEIVIELKTPPPSPAASAPRPTVPGQAATTLVPGNPPVTHVGIARRGSTTTPPRLPAVAPERTYGQLGVTKLAENPIYRKQDTRSQLLSRPPVKQYVVVQKADEGWYSVLMADGSTGYIQAGSVELLDYRVTDVQLGAGMRGSGPPPPGTPMASSLLQEAYRYLGVPYVWGGSTERGLDCSGFVQRCFGTCGVGLPRTASEQAQVGAPVDFSQLQAGDRLYFSVHKQFDHTAIYIGDGYFIHSSSGAGHVVIDNLSSKFYSRTLAAARR